jgi:hypothetical protein
MSSFTYDGPRNVLCTPAPMSGDGRIQPTPEPTLTLNSFPAREARSGIYNSIDGPLRMP